MSTTHSSHHHGHFVEALIDWEHHHDTAVAVMTIILAFLLAVTFISIGISKLDPTAMTPRTESTPVTTPYYY